MTRTRLTVNLPDTALDGLDIEKGASCSNHIHRIQSRRRDNP